MGQTESKITLEQLVAESGVKLESLEEQCSEQKLLDLAEYCDPISVVGHALGLTRAQISAIDNDYRTTKEKRLALMQQWKDSKAYQATYKNFIEALLHSGNADLAAEVCQMLASESKVKASDTSVSEQQTPWLESKSCDVHDVKPTLDLAPVSAQASSDDVEYVPVAESVPVIPPRIVPIADKVRRFERQYRSIGRNLIKSLMQDKVLLEDLKIYVATLPLSVQQYYEELETNLLSSQTNKATCISEFVEAINKYSNIFSPALLADVIEEYGDKHTKSMMNGYIAKLEQFQTETQVKQLVGVFHAMTPEGYTEIELELKPDWEEKTLKDIAPPKRTWLLKNVIYGSLRVFFSIDDIEVLEEDDVREYLQTYVKRVFVDGECVLNFASDEAAALAIIESEVVQQTFTLPESIDFRFSSISHGKNIILSEDGLEAHRKGRYISSDAGVYVATPLRGTCEFEVEVTDFDNSIYGSLCIGVSQCPAGTYKHLDIPHKINRSTKDSCAWSFRSVRDRLGSDVTETTYGSTSLHDLKKGDRVAVKILENGDLHYFLNGMDQGRAVRNVYKEEWDIYPFMNIIGSCIAVKITTAVTSDYGHTADDQDISPQNVQFRFHPVTGKNIVLFEDRLYARRIDPEYVLEDGVVYGAMPIKHRGTFEVIITEYGKHGRGNSSIQIGLMRLPTKTELHSYDIPKYSIFGGNHLVWSCNQIYGNLGSNLVKRYYGRVDLRSLQEGDKVGMHISSEGTLYFFVNGKSQGIAARGLHNEPDYNIYPLVDVCDNCHAVRIIKAETQLEEVLDLEELCIQKIASSLHWSKDVQHLPLPQRMKDQIEQCIYAH